MSIEVKSINVQDVKNQLKECPKKVKEYVKSLESVLKANQYTLSKAIGKLKTMSETKFYTMDEKPKNWDEVLVWYIDNYGEKEKCLACFYSTTNEWHFHEEDMRMALCWTYLPDPTEFLNNLNKR